MNPFSAKRLRPGVIPYLFSAAEGWHSLEERFAKAGEFGQVVGRHGTGKSTLFVEWRERWQSRDRDVIWLRLQNGRNRQDRGAKTIHDWRRLLAAPRGSLVMIDGFEQWNAVQRSFARAWLRVRGAGMLVTTHCDVGLPTMLTTKPTGRLACRVAGEILNASLCSHCQSHLPSHPLPHLDSGAVVASELTKIPDEVVESCWAQCRGNIRETLFLLYDWFETDVELIAAPAKSA